MWVKKDAVIRRMLTYADVCGQKGWGDPPYADKCWRLLTSAVCWRMLTYAAKRDEVILEEIVHVCFALLLLY
jgi:hypothetical protein